MEFDPEIFAEPLRSLLRQYAARVLPLTRTAKCKAEDADQVTGATPLFRDARAPEAAVCGLLLLSGCWERSHEVSQELSSREGSYWHAIAHRIEPDSANAAYWFRRVGEHAIFPELRQRAAEILQRQGAADWRLRPVWDPYLFINWCDEARVAAGSEKERAALAIQSAEWELLFQWCALAPVR